MPRNLELWGAVFCYEIADKPGHFLCEHNNQKRMCYEPGDYICTDPKGQLPKFVLKPEQIIPWKAKLL